MSHSNFVLAAGETVRHRVLSLSIAPEKVKIVRVGPKEFAAEFTNKDMRSVAARHMLGLSSLDFVVGSVGRLAFGKGLETLMKPGQSEVDSGEGSFHGMG